MTMGTSLRADLGDVLSFLKGFTDQAPAIGGGAASVGEAAAYALVWEWGNTRQTKQGPRTVRGINPDGESVWLSSQAPMGYISLHEDEFLVAIGDEVSQVDFSDGILKAVPDLLSAADRSSARIAYIISQNAPIDSGDLADSIQPLVRGAVIEQENFGG